MEAEDGGGAVNDAVASAARAPARRLVGTLGPRVEADVVRALHEAAPGGLTSTSTRSRLVPRSCRRPASRGAFARTSGTEGRLPSRSTSLGGFGSR